jgi:hypothetical protein
MLPVRVHMLISTGPLPHNSSQPLHTAAVLLFVLTGGAGTVFDDMNCHDRLECEYLVLDELQGVLMSLDCGSWCC